MPTPERLLVVGLNWIGDAVMSLPTLFALRQTYPEAKIIVAARGWSADVYRMCPAADEVVPLRKLSGVKAAGIFFDNANRIRKLAPELAVVLPNSFSAALLSYWARIPRRIGYCTDGRGFLLNNCLKLSNSSSEQHTVRYYKALLEDRLDIDWPEGEERFVLEPEAVERDRALTLLSEKGLRPGEPFIALSAGAAWGEPKRWPPEKFARCADGLLKQSSIKQVVLLGSPDDAELNQSITSEMEREAVDAAGLFDNLQQLAAAIDMAALLIGNDSGPMHLAAALATPIVALFGPSDENKTGPWAPRSRARLLRAAGSAPWKRFRRDSDEPRTMQNIAVEAVEAAALELLQEAK